MTAPTQANPAEGIFFVGGYDPAGHQVNVGLRLVNVQTDSSVSPPVVYGDIPVNVEVTTNGPAVQRVDAQSGDFVAGSIVDLATLAAAISAGRMLITPPANTNVTEANSASILADLATLAGAISAGRMLTTPTSNQSVNLAQVLGSAMSASNPAFFAQTVGGAVLADANPEPNISNIQQMILNGKSFSCSTDFVTAAAGMAGEFFIPNTNAKNIIIWSVRLAYTNATQFAYTRYITGVDTNIDTAGTSVIGNVLNMKGGGAAPASGATFKYNSGVAVPSISASSLPIGADNTAQNSSNEIFAPGEFRYIPPSTAGGIAVYHNTTAAGKWSMTVRWTEF